MKCKQCMEFIQKARKKRDAQKGQALFLTVTTPNQRLFFVFPRALTFCASFLLPF